VSEIRSHKVISDPNSYTIPVIIALVLHLIAALLLWIEWPAEHKKVMAEPTPKHIQAKVIQTENKAVKQRREAEQKRLAKKRRDEKRRKELARKKAAEKKRLAAKKKAEADKKKALEKKRLAEKKKQEAAEKARIAQEKARAEQQAEEEKRLAEELQQEEELLQAMALEEEMRRLQEEQQAKEQAAANEKILSDFAAQIKAKVSSVWRYPPSARPEMETQVSIQLLPSGEVVSVDIVQGSGNQALDRSVLAAVKKAQPLPVPENIRLFEQQFRRFTMAFRPEDATW